MCVQHSRLCISVFDASAPPEMTPRILCCYISSGACAQVTRGLQTSLIRYHIQAVCTYLPAHNVCFLSCTLKEKKKLFYSSSLGCFFNHLNCYLRLYFRPNVCQTKKNFSCSSIQKCPKVLKVAASVSAL